jgi:alanine-synthesizing transaminase
MKTDFHRITRLPAYVFAEVNRLKAIYRDQGKDIIDFGMGNPDIDTESFIVDKLVETVRKPKTHRYSVSKGIKGLRKAQAEYYERRFSVKLDPEKEIIATLGSKEGLANLAMAITDPGDVILVPNPSYPIHPYGFIIAGGSLRHIPTLTNGQFDEDEYFKTLTRSLKHISPKPVAIVVSFPSNPTTKTCSLKFYEELVKVAKQNDVWILSDLAYAEIYFGNDAPPSILQIPNAKSVAVEFTSMSKTFSMPGWRMGFAVGNEILIAALEKIKSYLDYGAFTPIQVAAARALSSDETSIIKVREIYKKRRDVLVNSMQNAGWEIPPPDATMFAWAPIPEKFRSLGSLEFSKILLKEADISVAPGIGFGEYGENFVRIGLVENEHRIRQAARNVKSVFSRADEIIDRFNNGQIENR